MNPIEEMKNREIATFNRNYSETERILTEVRDKLHSKNRLNTIKELEDIKSLITEYIDILKQIGLTVHQRSHFEETMRLPDRNKEYNINAINSLETSLEVVKDKIKRREAEQLNNLPKSLSSKLSDEKLFKLRRLLIAGNYIGEISEADFIYIFREQPIKEAMAPIQWKSYKVRAKVLLNIIVNEGFSNPIANKCFILAKNPKSKMFDSNVELTTSYPDIDDIIRQLE